MNEAAALPSIKQLRVLIVDDRCDDYHGLFKLLEHRGHTYVCCTSVKEGLACFQTNSFDVVVLDILFPDTTPDDVIKSMNYFNPAKVICVTGSDDPRLRKTCLARGAADFVIKGTSEFGLYDAILKAVSDDHGESDEFDREMIVNRKLAIDKKQGFWQRYKMAMAIVASTLAVVVTTGTVTVGVVRWIYTSGGENRATKEQIDGIVKAIAQESNDRHDGDMKLAHLLETLSQEFQSRKEVVDKAFKDDEARDSESRSDRNNINKRIDGFTSDLGVLRGEMTNGFNRMTDGQNKLYNVLINLNLGGRKKNDDG